MSETSAFCLSNFSHVAKGTAYGCGAGGISLGIVAIVTIVTAVALAVLAGDAYFLYERIMTGNTVSIITGTILATAWFIGDCAVTVCAVVLCSSFISALSFGVRDCYRDMKNHFSQIGC